MFTVLVGMGAAVFYLALGYTLMHFVLKWW